MAGNDITQGSGEIFNAEKPSLLKRAFQVAGAALSTLTGDGTNHASDCTHEQGWHRLHKTGRWCDAYEAGDGTRCRARPSRGAYSRGSLAGRRDFDVAECNWSVVTLKHQGSRGRFFTGYA